MMGFRHRPTACSLCIWPAVSCSRPLCFSLASRAWVCVWVRTPPLASFGQMYSNPPHQECSSWYRGVIHLTLQFWFPLLLGVIVVRGWWCQFPFFFLRWVPSLCCLSGPPVNFPPPGHIWWLLDLTLPVDLLGPCYHSGAEVQACL